MVARWAHGGVHPRYARRQSIAQRLSYPVSECLAGLASVKRDGDGVKVLGHVDQRAAGRERDELAAREGARVVLGAVAPTAVIVADAAKALINRGVAADATLPAGDGWLVRTTDADRSVRDRGGIAFVRISQRDGRPNVFKIDIQAFAADLFRVEPERAISRGHRVLGVVAKDEETCLRISLDAAIGLGFGGFPSQSIEPVLHGLPIVSLRARLRRCLLACPPRGP